MYSFLFFIFLSSLSQVSNLKAHDAMPAGPMTINHSYTSITQKIKFSNNFYAIRSFYKKSGKVTCAIRTNGILAPHQNPVYAWINVNGFESYIRVNFYNEGGYDSRFTFKCPKKNRTTVQFAFNLGDGVWNNNHGHDFNFEFPLLEQ